MDFEPSCESAWTINKLSAFLSGFVHFDSLKDAVVNFYRRCMVYPIYRNLKLVDQIKLDLSQILTQLPRIIPISLVCLVLRLFHKCEPRYLLNILYIEDLLVFSQKIEEAEYLALGTELAQIKVSKADLDLDLEEIEREGFVLEAD